MAQKEFHEMKMMHQWLENRGIRHQHSVNETPSKMRAVFQKQMGVSPGFPDLLIWLPVKGKLVRVAIEMKQIAKTAKATPAQREWLEFLASDGWRCGVANGWLEAVEFLKELGWRGSQTTDDFSF